MIEITDLQLQAMADILVNPQQWIEDAVNSKVERCVERVVAKEQQRLLEDPDVLTIPATIDGILESHFSQPDYKTRAERDAEEEALQMSMMDVSGSSDA